jgi:hypothetical protein
MIPFHDHCTNKQAIDSSNLKATPAEFGVNESIGPIYEAD